MGKSVLKGAIILTGAGFITKILGFIYRIYLSKTIGAEGIGIYQLVLPLYLFAGTISASGIAIAVSKLISAERAKGNFRKIKKIANVSVFLTGVTGTVISAVLFIFADSIALTLFKEPGAALSIKVMAPCVPFMAVSSALHGYFFALMENKHPASAQIIEQICRMGCVYLILGFFAGKGLPFASAAAYIGVTAGEIISAVYIYIQYKKSVKCAKNSGGKSSYALCFWELAKIFVPITAGRSLASLLHMAENTLIPLKLEVFGMTGALAGFGALKGMALPLLYFPTAFLSSLAITMLPSVSGDSALGNTALLGGKTKKAILYTFVMGIFMTAVFIIFPKEIAMAVYKEPSVGKMLFMLAFACPFIYIELIVVGILAGLGRQGDVFKASIIESVISLIFVLFLVERFGIAAYIAGIAVSAVTVSFINIRKLLKITCICVDFKNWFLKPVFSAAVSGILSVILYNQFLQRMFPEAVSAFAAISSMAGTYVILLIALKCIGIERLKPLSFKRY